MQRCTCTKTEQLLLLHGWNEINRGGSRKDLGVWISADMKCSQQCMYVFNKASKVMGMIKRMMRFKEVRIMLSLYKALEMWANAQRDGRPAEYRWHPLFNAAKFG